MAEIYTFDIVPSDIGRVLPRIAFSTDSAPTQTQAEEIILDFGAELSAFLTGMGVAVQAVNDHPTYALYRVCQRYLLLRFAAQVIRLRNQNDQTMADRLDTQADGLKEMLRTRPADMGAQRPNGSTSPNILRSNANFAGEIYTKAINSRSRVAINAAVDRM